MKNETQEAIARNSMGLFRLGRKTQITDNNLAKDILKTRLDQDKLLEAHIMDNDRNLKESLARIEALEENESLTIETLDCQIKRIVALEKKIEKLEQINEDLEMAEESKAMRY